jgi:hypothetical protein
VPLAVEATVALVSPTSLRSQQGAGAALAALVVKSLPTRLVVARAARGSDHRHGSAPGPCVEVLRMDREAHLAALLAAGHEPRVLRPSGRFAV